MRRPPRLFLLWLLACTVAGCAALWGKREPDPEERLTEGLAALERKDYRSAFDHLVWVYTNYWDEPVGRQALLALAAAELDPRNPSRRLGVGSRLAASYLRLPQPLNWTEPVVETMYLLALELGAAEERAERAEEEREEAEAEREEAEAEREEAEAEQARAEARAAEARAQAAPPRPLPRLPGPPVTARIRELERERARLARRVEQLESQLAACQQELERVQRTLRQ